MIWTELYPLADAIEAVLDLEDEAIQVLETEPERFHDYGEGSYYNDRVLPMLENMGLVDPDDNSDGAIQFCITVYEYLDSILQI